MALSIETKEVKSLLSLVTKGQLKKVPTETVKFFINHWSLILLFGYVILSMHLSVSIYTGTIYDDTFILEGAMRV